MLSQGTAQGYYFFRALSFELPGSSVRFDTIEEVEEFVDIGLDA